MSPDKAVETWSEIGGRFEALARTLIEPLDAHLVPVGQAPNVRQEWTLRGGGKNTANSIKELRVLESSFRAIAANAAAAAQLKGDPVQAWCDTLTKTEHFERHTSIQPPAVILDADDEPPAIRNVLQASVDLCRTFEANARISDGHRPTPLAKNIDRLRLECGWTFDALADVVGVSRDSVIDHVNRGTKPRPETLANYASVFSEKLGRAISVEDLQR